MKKRISIGSCSFLIILFCIATFFITAVADKSIFDNKMTELYQKSDFYDKLYDVHERVSDKYIKGTNEAQIDDAYLTAYIKSLGDPYSEYLTKEEMELYINNSQSEMVGIGVHITFDEETEGIYITGIMPDSPALDAGLQAGDIIIKVEDIIVSEDTYYKAIDTVKGAAGQVVNLVIKRGEENIDFSITRAEFDSESVIYELLDNNTAYITILQFKEKTAESFKQMMERATDDQCDKFIFDMRNNPGGHLNEIVAVLDYLLPKGPIINIVDKDGNVETRNSDADCITAPMVVLVNNNTASAAELFTAALRDYEAATVVGTKTFGKGTMQTITPLPDGSGLRLSTHYYNPPYGENYDGTGIAPDIEIEMPEELKRRFYMLTKEEDNQLQKAIEIVNQKY